MFRRKAKASHPLRYLVYLSETKIDMLFNQIPDNVRRNLVTELKIDLKLLSLKINRDATPSADNSISKMNIVERHIEDNHKISGPEAGIGYFRAQVNMDWVVLDDDIVIFVGRCGNRLIFLGGSASNLIGGSHLAQGLGSHASVIHRKLASLIAGANQDQIDDIGTYLPEVFQHVFKSPQRAEFLARHLTHGKLEQPSMYQTYIVGSPLIVELTSESLDHVK